MIKKVIFQWFVNRARNDTARTIMLWCAFFPFMIMAGVGSVYCISKEMYGIALLCMAFGFSYSLYIMFGWILSISISKLDSKKNEYRIIRPSLGRPIVIDTRTVNFGALSKADKIEFEVLDCDENDICANWGVAFNLKQSEDKLEFHGFDTEGSFGNQIQLFSLLKYDAGDKKYKTFMRHDKIGQINAYLYQTCKNQTSTIAGYETLFDKLINGSQEQQIKYLDMFRTTANMAAGIRAETNTAIHKGDDPELERLRILQNSSKKKTPGEMNEEELTEFIKKIAQKQGVSG